MWIVDCILTHLDQLEREAAQAPTTLAVVHVDAMALFDLLADRRRDYANGWAPVRRLSVALPGMPSNHVCPADPWLRDLLAPTEGRILRRADVTRVFDAHE